MNPAHDTVGGRRRVRPVQDIEDDVWLAVIADPAASLPEVIDQCIAARVRGAVIVTAIDGTDVDIDALVDPRSTQRHAGHRPRQHGRRRAGPVGRRPRPARAGRPAAGRVAISMQSGSLGASLLQLASYMHIGLSWFVSLGDKSDVSANDLLQFWEDDETTGVIAMYTESFGNPRKFARIARRVCRTVPSSPCALAPRLAARPATRCTSRPA